MSIDYDVFLEWAKDRFGEENIKFYKGEICTNSIFSMDKLGIEDHRHNLWMNPSGGKHQLPAGVFRCWLTDTMGSLVRLVAKVDNIPYDEAEELISNTVPLRTLERKVHEFFLGKQEVENVTDLPVVQKGLSLPDFTFKIPTLSVTNSWRRLAIQYLADRKLPPDDLYVCTGGDYKNRIVIPYYDRDGKLIWFNARTMSKNKNVIRYMKPSGAQDEVLYFTDWPRPGTRIYLTEGEFDALTLFLAGFHAAACGGKYLSDSQVEMLRGYKVGLAFDADEPGREALVNIGSQLLGLGFSDTTYVRPPVVYKDWNKLLEKRNIHIVKAYVDRFEAPFTDKTAKLFLAQRL